MSRSFALIVLLATCFRGVVPVWADDSSVSRPVVEETRSTDDISEELRKLLALKTPWAFSGSAEASGGYKDNLLLSHLAPERSGFARASVEALVWRLPAHRIDYFAFVNAEATRYFTSDVLEDESAAFTGFEWRYRLPEVLSLGLGGQGYYLDQLFDVSDTAVQRVVAELQVWGWRGGPTIRWSPRSWAWVEIGGTAGREKYRDGSNDAKQAEAAARVGWQPHDRLEISLGGSERWRDYATRERYTASGRIDAGLLAIHETQRDARLRLTLDKRSRWRSTTIAGELKYDDNGSGFLDYRQKHASQELEWTDSKWVVRLEVEGRRKEYRIQTVGVGIVTAPLMKEEAVASVYVQRAVSNRWSVFAEYLWERSRSNDVFARYEVNEGLLGLRWSWEK